jgi:hypothetical protein
LIKVDLQPEPNDFDVKVRLNGQSFLATTPRPRGKQWKNKEFWREAISDMTAAYQSICAYSSLWIKPDQPTIDHYISRDENPALAYEWENFRLARWRINTRKRNHKDVLDPFNVGENWFELDFTTFGIKPNSEIEDVNIKKAVQDTIDRLELDNIDYREARESWFNAFRNNIAELEKKAPFIAYEMKRQGILNI